MILVALRLEVETGVRLFKISQGATAANWLLLAGTCNGVHDDSEQVLDTRNM
jgi:hypothetical protein